MFIYAGVVAVLLLLLAWAFRTPRKRATQKYQLASLEETGPRHATYFAVIRQALTGRDAQEIQVLSRSGVGDIERDPFDTRSEPAPGRTLQFEREVARTTLMVRCGRQVPCPHRSKIDPLELFQPKRVATLGSVAQGGSRAHSYCGRKTGSKKCSMIMNTNIAAASMAPANLRSIVSPPMLISSVLREFRPSARRRCRRAVFPPRRRTSRPPAP